MSDPIITFSGVAFGYRGARRVLSDFSATWSGPFTLLLGPNGAGKSTLLGLAATTLRPSGGRVDINGMTVTRRTLRECRRRVAWMPQAIDPLPGFTVREQVAYVGWLKGLTKADAWDASRDALARADLTELADRATKEVSGGELRRVGIAQTLVTRARWILLDEPTAGLDPLQREEFAHTIHRIHQDVNLVVSTHQIDDLLPSVTDVMIVAQGAVRYAGSLDDLPGETKDDSRREHLMRTYRSMVGEESATR